MNKVLLAFYDLSVSPISYDYAHWIVHAMCVRDDFRCEKLHVVVVPKDDGIGGFSRDWGGYDEAEARWRLWHLVAGLTPLAGATLTIAESRAHALQMQWVSGESETPTWFPEERAHFVRDLVARSRLGKKMPLLRATAAARRHVDAWLKGETRPIVTLTTREHVHAAGAAFAYRNTNSPAWAEFAQWLGEQGYRAIHLKDTVAALSEGRGHAELDCDLRLALYERAAMNCLGHNGPISLLWLSSAPYLCFDSTRGRDWKDIETLHDLGAGQQFPWAHRLQRMTPAFDDLDAMRAEFHALMARSA